MNLLTRLTRRPEKDRIRTLEEELISTTQELVDTLKITLKYCPVTKNESLISQGSRKWAYVLRLAYKYHLAQITASHKEDICAVFLL